MNWKADLGSELADAIEIVSRMHIASLHSDTLTPEIVELADRLKRRADVILGYVARQELLAQDAKLAAMTDRSTSHGLN